MRHAISVAFISLVLAMQAAGTPVATQHLVRRQQEQKDDSKDDPKSAETRTRNAKDDKHSEKQQLTTATAVAVAQPSATVDTNSKGKVNVTLASMQYSQSLCTNTSQVLSESWLNITWNAKGKFSSTLYAKYGTDGFNAWTPGMSTQANTEGKRLDGNKKKDNLAVDWQMSYQHQVFQYNKAVIFTIAIRDEALNATIAIWDTKKIAIVGNCEKKGQTVQTKKTDKDDDTHSQEEVDDASSGTAAASTSAGAAADDGESQRGGSSADQSAAASPTVSCRAGVLLMTWIASAILVSGL